MFCLEIFINLMRLSNRILKMSHQTKPMIDAIDGNVISKTKFWRVNSYCKAGRHAGSPGPLKIITAQPASHIHRLADEVQAGHLASHHRLL